MADYKDKIRKLLALAESANENEAKMALLRARELMAKHKLTELDLADAKEQAIREAKTDITCSKRRDPWIIDLTAVIGENYCCQGCRTRVHGKQTQHISFIGLESDAELCAAIFKYAVDCIRAGIKAVRKENAERYPWYIKQQCDSYGYGFTNGIEKAFTSQDEEQIREWGLALVMPQAVQEAVQGMKHEPFKARAQDTIDPHAYAHGFTDGKAFDPTRRLGKGSTT